ncbi:MAG: PKD domain-containing protein [Bacteroidetes bacterium]|jgi:uncharacterized protein (TIGR02145 family)|nr:PKD domain-containing protein [Bacteroidota bacterium]MBT4398586.1 PKD domain-containing protein [Bacteroidota bacterium]MBT7092344.1 PKD domain-containing protein [Bacteroidota bacterium]MBT7463875.1 PKD domain-containing protein [Bacteroidota bacterium]
MPKFALNWILFKFLPLLILTSCSKDKLPPTAVASAFPAVADSTILIEFNGSQTTDNNTYLRGLLFSWDFEGNGHWDVYREQETVFTHTYVKSGTYTAKMQVEDHRGLIAKDFVEIRIKPANHLTESMTDPRDGKTYKTVFLSRRWWMAENLNYGNWIHSNQEQSDNQAVEKYFYQDDSSAWATFGGIYHWNEAINYSTNHRGICPAGWSIPSHDEWKQLMTDIDPWYAWQYYGELGLSQFNIQSGFAARRENDTITWFENLANHWSRDYFTAPFLREQAPYAFYFKNSWGKIGIQYRSVLYDESDHIYLIASVYASIRCIKDE